MEAVSVRLECRIKMRSTTRHLAGSSSLSGRGEGQPRLRVPEGNADRAQGRGHRVRRRQLTPCLCRQSFPTQFHLHACGLTIADEMQPRLGRKPAASLVGSVSPSREEPP